MSEQLTAEEAAALESVKAEAAPVIEETQDAPTVPAAEAPPETPAAVEPEKPPPGMVPQGALHQERERRKEAERQTQDFQRQMADLQAQIAKLTAPPPAEIVVPDPVLDPKGFREFQIKQITERAQEKVEAEKRAMEAKQQQQIMARLNQDVQAFRGITPDYDTAFQHAVKARREELAFYGNSEEQIAAQMEVDVQAIVQTAYSQGKNPAELFYTYAKMRGYAPPPVARPQAAVQVTALAEAQRQTQSLAPAGGPANDGGMTLETLAKMSEADLAKMPKAQRDEMMRKVMGG